MSQTRSQIGSLHKLRDIVCQLDVMVSFAQVSSSAGFCRPEFGSRMVLRSARHPILNHFSSDGLISNDTVSFTDVFLFCNFHRKSWHVLAILSSAQEMNEESNFHVITGANMSGKSTYIRQVMLLQIMAQVNCFKRSRKITNSTFPRRNSTFQSIGKWVEPL